MTAGRQKGKGRGRQARTTCCKAECETMWPVLGSAKHKRKGEEWRGVRTMSYTGSLTLVMTAFEG